MTIQVFTIFLLTYTTIPSSNKLANSIETKIKKPSSENLSDSSRKLLIVNRITGISNRDWRKQVNQLKRPFNDWLSDTPTNVVTCKLFCKTGYHLQIRRDGVVCGTMDRKSKYSECNIKSCISTRININRIRRAKALYTAKNFEHAVQQDLTKLFNVVNNIAEHCRTCNCRLHQFQEC